MRTRFAPSPTGFLHIGGLRTALFAYLHAKKSKGKFILRIEDTDKQRTVQGAVEDILKSLCWAGLRPDEGVMISNGILMQNGQHGPYIQSERFAIYREYAEKLVGAGSAYYAFDTKEELGRMREEEAKAGVSAPKYDASVRMRMKNSLTMKESEWKQKIADAEPYVIRMKIPDGDIVKFEDEIRGCVEFHGMEIDDQILLKSDGFPTYHLASVVDDHLMEIDTVIRGEEWLSSTPKHLLLFEYFGWKAPEYAHVPLLLGKEGGKLSKRQGDTAVRSYIEKGYIPEAVVNFIAMLGWNPGTTREIFSMEELESEFSLERIQKSGAVFDATRLDWFQGQWIRKLRHDEFAARILPYVAERFPEAVKDEQFTGKAHLIQERITFLNEAPEMMGYFYREPTVTLELLAEKKQKLTKNSALKMISILIETLEPINDWTEEALTDALESAMQRHDLKKGQLLWPLRASLTGLPFSPGAFEIAFALGKEKTMKRLATAKNLNTL